jgi:hypothetical protein
MLYAPYNAIQSVTYALQMYSNKHISQFTLNSNVMYFIKKFVSNEQFTQNDIDNLNAWFKSHAHVKQPNLLWDLHGGDSAFNWVTDAIKLADINSHYRGGVFIRGYAQNRGKRSASNPQTISNADKPVPNTVNYPILYKRARIMARQKYGLLPNAYSNAYMIAAYEKLVKQTGGKPYSHMKSIYNQAETVLSYELDESKKLSFEYLDDIQNWFNSNGNIIKE